MSFPQLGYPQYLYGVGAAADRQLLAPPSVSPASPPSAASSRGGNCDVAGSACAAVTSLLAAGAGGAGGVYAHPYGYGAFLPYTSAAELALFSQMGSQYDLKDSPGVSFAAHASPAAFYPYAGFQYGDASRPKNATRESTSTLKAWLNEHRKNPYPTKGEKIMLAIITKMTLTQVSTWFANARRRLKKENKVTWGARAKEDGEDGEDGTIFGSDNEDKREDEEEIDLESIDIDKIDENDGDRSNAEEEEDDDEDEDEEKRAGKLLKERDDAHVHVNANANKNMTVMTSPNLQLPVSSKPKIWSLAETATSPDVSKNASIQHPAFLGNHRLYTCPIGKIHSWNNGAFLSHNSLLNVRSLVGVNQNHHHHPHQHHHHHQTQQQQQQQQQQQGVMEKDKGPEQLSPKHTERGVESPTQTITKSSFRPLHDGSRNPHRVLTT
ncbi:hypothetical protein PDJAM_G00004910 [Pangasius djambal]|uniref:Uncharacterized protein n=1 Tax=Pangasius djambal TaxID=1691987 RepID=A0ACC5XYU9_9TELE|nr:hypothetical protein [Pangasius djambal]